MNLKKRVEREFPLCLKENYPKQDLIMEIVSSLGIDIVPESIVVSPHLIRYFSYKMFQNWDPLRHFIYIDPIRKGLYNGVDVNTYSLEWTLDDLMMEGS